MITASMAALRALREEPGAPFDLVGPMAAFTRPAEIGDWLTTIGLLVFGLVCGLLTAAIFAARHGAAARLEEGEG